MRARDEASTGVRVEAPGGEQRWGGLGRGGVEYLEVRGAGPGLWPLTVEPVRDPYALGTEQGLRLFCTDRPLMPAPRRVTITTAVEGKGIPARVELASARMGTERPAAYTGADGRGTLDVIPGASGSLSASAGFEFASDSVPLPPGGGPVSIPLRRRLSRPPGWYCGDNHAHTAYYDGGDTPAQVVEAARSSGLDWITVTEHAQENRTRPALPQVRKAIEEALPGNEPGRFIVIPGMEFTTQTYHANVLNGLIDLPATASLQEVVDAARELDRPDHPVTMKLNHPTLGDGKAAELAREAERLPLIELWNSPARGAKLSQPGIPHRLPSGRAPARRSDGARAARGQRFRTKRGAGRARRDRSPGKGRPHVQRRRQAGV
jgi:hypothetical protein